MRFSATIWTAAALVALVLGGCHDDHENTGHACTAIDQCYPGVDQAALLGAVVCMDRVTGGYCTHQCVVDTDCCAAAGECETGFPQVCAPFESTGDRYCFLSCEGVADEATYCQEHANRAFSCRSTGGGAANRKVCVP